ncbi:alginate lyase-domain-containing protein [Mycena rebaudengoi]|nr:alginate lyase-domain-containing protein [Mycena rebaudengoi]
MLISVALAALGTIMSVLATSPNTVVVDGRRLVDAKVSLTTDPDLSRMLGTLTAQAKGWLSPRRGPWSVTNKKIKPPWSMADYTSQAPYWWPSNTSDGCPYVRKDGVRNPDADLYTDHNDRKLMFQSSYTLSLAWFYTGKEQYARKAGDVLRTWFVAPATRMTPHLEHAQLVPCVNTGRSVGIIDFAQQYTSVLDAAAILASGAPGWTASDIAAFKQWNVDYLHWLETSAFGKRETAAENNHGIFALLQSAGIALFTGNMALAKQKVLLAKPRIDAYIRADGAQPLELARSRSFHYSTFTLAAYTRLAAIGKKVGVDLWGYTGPEGQSIHGAVDFILPAATGAADWAYPELQFEPFSGGEIVRASAEAGNHRAIMAQRSLQPPPGGDLWLLRPAVEP